jgi:peptidoglycan/LPS O-acetylase OafA/YrhL
MHQIKIFRWVLRILSGILIVFFLFMFIGETFFPPESLQKAPLTTMDIIQLGLFGLIMVGLGLAWKWEFTGGLVALMAFIAMAMINPGTLQFSPLLIYPTIAVLFIVLWAMSKRTNRMHE